MGRLRYTQHEMERVFQKAGLKLLEKYKGIRVKVLARCSQCLHKWKIRPYSVKQGSSCPRCAIAKHRLPFGEVKKHFTKRNLKIVGAYKNLTTPVPVQCSLCGHKWKVVPSSVVHHKTGCQKCYWESMRTQVEDLLRQRQLELLGPFKNLNESVPLRCLTCGTNWTVNIGSILYADAGCPECFGKQFETESKIRAIFEKLTGWKFPKVRPTWLKGRGKYSLELDGYNKRHSVAFEYQGEQHYKSIYGEETFDLVKRNDARKRSLASYHGVLLICIPYWKRDVESFIRSKLAKAGLL